VFSGNCRISYSSTGLFPAPQLFSNNATQEFFQGFLGRVDVVVQGAIDQRLITTATGPMSLLAKPLQDIIVETDRDPRFARRRGQNRSALAFAEIILFSHAPLSYCFFSRRVARLAEMSLTRRVSPRPSYV